MRSPLAGNLKKFVNPKFLKTIDLALMRRLLARHEDKLTDFTLDLLDQDEADGREALRALLAGSEDTYPEGLRGDLHRIAELADAKGLEIIQSQAERQGVDLFPDIKTGDDAAPTKSHDPKHLAVRVFLEHQDLFNVAADYLALMTADRLYEYAGRERGAAVDPTAEKIEVFRQRVGEIFKDAFLGDFCRVGEYVDGDEVNLVISHGSLVSTMPIVEGVQERVISVRAVSHAVLRYSETTGVLRLARIRKAQQPRIAELFAEIVLGRPGFFAGDDAQHLYTFEPIEEAGLGFTFTHHYDPQIDRVLIMEAAADLMAPGKKGYPRAVRTYRSRDPISGDALQHLSETPVSFASSWRLAELVLRILFKGDGRRQPQVTVKIRPPSVVQFRRTQHEERVMTLLERNGLIHDRDDLLVVDAAE